MQVSLSVKHLRPCASATHVLESLSYTNDLNSDFSFSKTGGHTKIKEPNLLNYCKCKSPSWIWTQVAEFASYDDNCYEHLFVTD